MHEPRLRSEIEDDVGDEVQVTRKKIIGKVARQQEITDLISILGTYGGRTFFWRMLEQARIYDNSFDRDHSVMSYREGRRSMGLWTLQEIETAVPGVMDKMRIEAKERERK